MAYGSVPEGRRNGGDDSSPAFGYELRLCLPVPDEGMAGLGDTKQPRKKGPGVLGKYREKDGVASIV